MNKISSAKSEIDAAADKARLLFADPPTPSSPVHQLPSITSLVILQAQVSLIHTIERNPPPGSIRMTARWSSILGLVVLDRVGRALGVYQEIATLAQKFSSSSALKSHATPLPSSLPTTQSLPTISDSSSSSSSSSSSNGSSQLAPTTTTSRTGETSLQEHCQSKEDDDQPYSNNMTTAASADITSGCTGGLRRCEGQRNLFNVHSDLSATDPPSTSTAPTHLQKKKAKAAAKRPQGVENECTHVFHHHTHYYCHHHSPSPPPPLRDPSSSRQRETPITPAPASSPQAFKRNCCIPRPAHEQRPWRHL